jgi:hypothetical protein
MKFKWAALAAALALLPALLTGCQKNDWQTFAPAGGNFSVLMPGAPADKSREAVNGQPASHLYLSSTRDAVYAVSYYDRPASKDAIDPEKWLDRARDLEVAQTGGKLLGASPLKLANTWPGREILTTVPKGDGKHAMRCHMYLVNNRLYRVLVVLPQDDLSSAEAVKFLDSFKLE